MSGEVRDQPRRNQCDRKDRRDTRGGDAQNQDQGCDSSAERLEQANEFDRIIESQAFGVKRASRDGHHGSAQQQHHCRRDRGIHLLLTQVIQLPTLLRDHDAADDEHRGGAGRSSHRRDQPHRPFDARYPGHQPARDGTVVRINQEKDDDEAKRHEDHTHR